MENDEKNCFNIKNMIWTSKRLAEHLFAGQNTQQTILSGQALIFLSHISRLVMCLIQANDFPKTIQHLLMEKFGFSSSSLKLPNQTKHK